jgi:hypothetical protein
MRKRARGMGVFFILEPPLKTEFRWREHWLEATPTPLEVKGDAGGPDRSGAQGPARE